MSLSKKIRFEVFKRDGFTCQYCGEHPPNVTLEVDHIIPKSKDGTDDIFNLTTSCFNCNRGKSDIELSSVPITLSENIEILKEKENQYKEYKKILRNIDKRVNSEIMEVEIEFQKFFTDSRFSEYFKPSVKKFINSLGINEVKDAMSIACSRQNKPNNALRYFCGICWNKIKSDY